MIGSILAGIAGPWRLWIELGVVAVLLAALGAQTVRMENAREGEARAVADTATVRRDWALQAAAGASAALAAADRNRQTSAELQRTRDEAEHALQTDRAAAARVADGLARDRDGLRNQLSAYAAGPARSSGAPDPAFAACVDRSQVLGGLLVEGMQLQDELAGDAEAAAGDVRALLAAWPKVSRDSSHSDTPGR